MTEPTEQTEETEQVQDVTDADYAAYSETPTGRVLHGVSAAGDGVMLGGAASALMGNPIGLPTAFIGAAVATTADLIDRVEFRHYEEEHPHVPESPTGSSAESADLHL